LPTDEVFWATAGNRQSFGQDEQHSAFVVWPLLRRPQLHQEAQNPITLSLTVDLRIYSKLLTVFAYFYIKPIVWFRASKLFRSA
jgi:hypothetical protein